MHPNNRLTVNAIEAYPVEDFSPEVSSEAACASSLPQGFAHSLDISARLDGL